MKPSSEIHTEHAQAKCTISVDKGIAEIVQFMVDFYTTTIIPYASCEGGDGIKAYIAFVSRSNTNLDHFLFNLFHPELHKGDVSVEYDIHSLFGSNYHVTWLSDYNEYYCQRARSLREKFKAL